MSLIKTDYLKSDTSGIMLTGIILSANIDFVSVSEYAIKALVGGLIWMGCKLAGDYFGAKLKDKK